MAQPNTVEIVEVCMVVPPPAASTTPMSLPLSFFDMRWVKLPPTERLFFYEISIQNSNTTNYFHSHIIPRLKQSLSLTLQHFLPLAGNLTWPPTSPKPVVKYAIGDAVSLTVANSNADFYQLSGSNDDNILCEAVEHRRLVPNLSVSHERAAVSAIQVTEFPNCGFSVGISMHHAILDGKTFSLFLKSWTHICRSLSCSLPPELKPIYDRGLIKDPAKLEETFAEQWLSLHGPDNRSLVPLDIQVQPDSFRGTFQFPLEKIEKLRQMVSGEIGAKYKNEQASDNDIHPLHISTFSLTCAYTWVCLVKAEGIKDDKILLILSVDCRSRLEPPLPPSYFGNCVGSRSIVVEREVLLGKNGIIMAVHAIIEAVKGLKSGVLDGAESWVSSITSIAQNPAKIAGRLYTIAGSPRFEDYSTDFGWGRPRNVGLITIDRTKGISLSDNRSGDGGVEIGVVLKKDIMNAFASFFAEGLESL